MAKYLFTGSYTPEGARVSSPRAARAAARRPSDWSPRSAGRWSPLLRLRERYFYLIADLPDHAAAAAGP